MVEDTPKGNNQEAQRFVARGEAPTKDNASQGQDKEVNLIEGYTSKPSFSPKDEPKAVLPAGKDEGKPEPKPEVKEKRKYAGKFADEATLEKSYLELERQFTQKNQMSAKRQRELEAEIARSKEELDLVKNRTNFKEQLTHDDINEIASRNPAEAIDTYFKQKRLEDQKASIEQRQKDEHENLVGTIRSNIDYMKDAYPEFQANTNGFADWMDELGVDSNRVMGDRSLAEKAYRDFCLASMDPEEVAAHHRQAGNVEASEKIEQMPPQAGTGSQPNPLNSRPTDNRFVPRGQPNKGMISNDPEPQTNPFQPAILDDMEKAMGIGWERGRDI